MAVRAVVAALAMWAALVTPAHGTVAAAAVEERELRQEGMRMLVAPDIPTNLTAVPEFNTMSQSLPLVRVSWLAPASGASVLAYKVYVNDKLIDTVNAGSWTQTKVS